MVAGQQWPLRSRIQPWRAQIVVGGASSFLPRSPEFWVVVYRSERGRTSYTYAVRYCTVLVMNKIVNRIQNSAVEYQCMYALYLYDEKRDG